MRILIVILAALFLAGCKGKTKPRKKPDLSKYIVDKSYCHDECLGNTFGNFHNKGESWGTGSSSMNGLSQQKIFDRVLVYCKDFYKNKLCCERDYDGSIGYTVIGKARYYGVCHPKIKPRRSKK